MVKPLLLWSVVGRDKPEGAKESSQVDVTVSDEFLNVIDHCYSTGVLCWTGFITMTMQ